MLFFLGLTASVLTAFIAALIGYEWWFKGQPLVSWRNFFLLGFMQFYTVSLIHWTITQLPSPVYLPRGEKFGTLAVCMVIFLALWLLCYRVGFRLMLPSRIVPQVTMPTTTSAFLVCAISLTFCSLLTIGLSGGTVGDSIIAQLRVPLISAAAGCATVLVISNPKNIAWWGLLIPITIMGLAIATIGTIDRRNFLSVLFVIAWIWYSLSLKFQSRPKLFIKLGVVGFIFFLALASYNAGRHYKNFGASFEDRIGQLKEFNPNLSQRNVIEGLFLQDTHICTQAIMENYGDNFPFQPLHGILYYFGNPIPRTIWQGKPEAMGIILQRQLAVPANLGIGCIGHGWAEMAWIGVIYYGIGLGLICGIADRLARMRANNPYFLISIGCSLGNVLGLARGETSLFMVLITVGFVASSVVFWLMKSTLRAYMLVGNPVLIDGRPLDLPVDQWTGYPLPAEELEENLDEPWYDDEGYAAPQAA